MTGAEAALPIWKRIVERGIEEGWIERGSSFPTPPGVTMARVEYNTGFLPGPGATQTVLEAFVAGTEPVRQYDPEWARVLKLPWYQQRPFYLPKAGERMPEDTEDWTTVQEAWDLKENPDGEKGGDDEG